MKIYKNYVSNLQVLEKAPLEDLSNEFIGAGIRNKFFLQLDLSCKVLKELLQYEGKSIGSMGSLRGIIKAAYSVWDFIDEELWLEMLKARNDLSHMYNEAAARDLVENILNKYIGEFQKLRMCLQEQYGEMLLEEEI